MWTYISTILLLLIHSQHTQAQSIRNVQPERDTLISRSEPNSNFGNEEVLEVSQDARVLFDFGIAGWDPEKDLVRAVLTFDYFATAPGDLIVAPLTDDFNEGDGTRATNSTGVGNDLDGSTWNCWKKDDDLSNSNIDCGNNQRSESGGDFVVERQVIVSFDAGDGTVSVDVTGDILEGYEEWILMYPDGQRGKMEISSEEVMPYEGAILVLDIYDQEYIFDDREIRNWNMIIEEDDMNFLLADPRAEEYVRCDMEFEGRTLWEDVGCRFKGDASNLKHCMDDVPLPIPDPWTHNCRTLHWQMDSNEFRDDKQRFHGLKKLQFHGFNENLQYISEHLAYEIWEEVGVPSARSAYVRLHINGEFSHLMMIVEELDDVFTKDRFLYDLNAGEGSIYKEPWANQLEAWYYDDVQLEDGPKNGQLWVDLALWAQEMEFVPQNEEEARALIEPVFNLEVADKHQAIVTLLNHGSTVNAVLCRPCRSPAQDPEGNPVASLTNDTRYRHNYFFYIEETEEHGTRFQLVPWDFDSTMSDSRISIQESPHWTIMPEEEGGSCDISESGTRFQASCDPLGRLWNLATRGRLVENYRHYGSIYSPRWFRERVTELKEFLRPQVETDPLTSSVREWEDFVDFWLETYLGPNLDGNGGTRKFLDDYIENDVAARIEAWDSVRRDGNSRVPTPSLSPNTGVSSNGNASCSGISGRLQGSTLGRANAQSEEGCCDSCMGDIDCNAWMWHGTSGRCILLRSVDQVTCDGGWVHNQKSMCSSSNFQPQRLSGDRISGLRDDLTANNDVECCELCVSNTECVGWSYYDTECVLRSAIGELQSPNQEDWVHSIIREC